MPPAPKASVLKEKAKSPSDTSTTKTLTPQRKHRKLLKDGSSEVWPETVEKIFVEGLRGYWESPWATYSRGRSRWRNQFLVDFLQKRGVARTKKQVASHIQVLRNMWKGEPEFHLVAGGEELFSENGLLAPPKLQCDTSGLISLDPEDADNFSPVTPSTPGLSPSEPFFENAELPSHSPASSSSPGDELPPPVAAAPSPTFTANDRISPIRTLSGTLIPPQSSARVPSSLVPHSAPSSPSNPAHSNAILPDQKHFSENKLCFIALWAEGMLPSAVPSDGRPFSSTRPLESIIVRIRLALSSIDDNRSPPALHGFQGTVSLASPWQFSAQCITKVYASGVCINEEVGVLQLVASHPPTPDGTHMIQALLPESQLSRCRWLDAFVQTHISQQIVVDNVTLAYIIYELDRKEISSAPSACLLSIQRYRAQNAMPFSLSQTSLPSCPYPITFSPTLHTHFIPRLIRRQEPGSLSCAVIPNHNLASFNTSLLF